MLFKSDRAVWGCGSLGHTIAEMNDNIQLIRIYPLLWQPEGWRCNGVWAELSGAELILEEPPREYHSTGVEQR